MSNNTCLALVQTHHNLGYKSYKDIVKLVIA